MTGKKALTVTAVRLPPSPREVPPSVNGWCWRKRTIRPPLMRRTRGEEMSRVVLMRNRGERMSSLGRQMMSRRALMRTRGRMILKKGSRVQQLGASSLEPIKGRAPSRIALMRARGRMITKSRAQQPA